MLMEMEGLVVEQHIYIQEEYQHIQTHPPCIALVLSQNNFQILI